MKAFPRDIEVLTMTARHIGVESELGVGVGNRTVSPALEMALSKRGLLHSIGHDGGGREFRTTPIAIRVLNQVRGCRYLSEYYEELGKHTKVLNSGGTHIHISILTTDHENMETNATAMAIAFYTQFQKIAGRKSGWAYRLQDRTLTEVGSHLARNCYANRRYGMKGSILGPTVHQTLEFRGPKGSNSSKEVLAWVEFLDNIVRTCNRKSIEGVQFKDLLKGERISEYISTFSAWRKLSKPDLERMFKGAALRV